MIIYKTNSLGMASVGTAIVEMQATRMNDKSVYYLSATGRELRSTRYSSYVCYHDSWESAHAYLITQAEGVVSSARRSLEIAYGKLGNIKGMKKPSEVAK